MLRSVSEFFWWVAVVAFIGSAIFGLFYGLASLDDDYWHQIDKNCWVHEHRYNHALDDDDVTRTVYCKVGTRP